MASTLMVACMAAAILICGTVPAEHRAGESREFDRMEFVWVPAVEFLLGSTSSEAMDHEQPVTRVEISRVFWRAKF